MRLKKFILSILALLNVIFIPVFDVWGGLFPYNADDDFFSVIGYVFDGEFDYWVVIFTLAIFIPSMLMFLASFSNSILSFKLSAGAGLLAMFIVLAKYVYENDFWYLYDFDDGNISIGTWIALTIFIISLFLIHKKREVPHNEEVI